MVNAPARPILAGVIAVRRTLPWAPFTTARDDRPRGGALLHCRHAPHLSCCPVCRTGGWSLDGCVCAWHHTAHHHPHHCAPWCDAASPSPPASARCPQAADPPRASGACLDAPRRQLARTCGAGSEACRLYAVLTVVTRAVGCTTTTNITHEDRWALKVGWASLEILGLIYLIYHMQLLSVF